MADSIIKGRIATQMESLGGVYYCSYTTSHRLKSPCQSGTTIFIPMRSKTSPNLHVRGSCRPSTSPDAPSCHSTLQQLAGKNSSQWNVAWPKEIARVFHGRYMPHWYSKSLDNMASSVIHFIMSVGYMEVDRILHITYNSWLLTLRCSNQRTDPRCGLSRMPPHSSRSEFLAVIVHLLLQCARYWCMWYSYWWESWFPMTN